MGWTAVLQPGSAAWTGRRCAIGSQRFNAAGPEGLIDNWTEGPKPRLSAGQWADFAAIVEAGPDRERDGVVRWRRNWEHVIPFFAFPVAVRRIIYTTNAIESLNAATSARRANERSFSNR